MVIEESLAFDGKHFGSEAQKKLVKYHVDAIDELMRLLMHKDLHSVGKRSSIL